MTRFGIMQLALPARGSGAERSGTYVPDQIWRGFHSDGRKHGLQVLFFRAEDVEFARRRVHAWTSSSPDGRSGWRRGWHPLPHVLYENYPYGSKGKDKKALAVKRDFRRRGIPVFNPPFFHKAELRRILSAVPELRPFLPDGRVVRRAEDVTDLLKSHSSVYLKPVNGFQGRGIIELKRLSGGQVQLKTGKREKGLPLEKVYSPSGIRELTARLLRNNRYLVEEGLDLRKKNNRKIDFRVVVHRGADGRWHSAGIRPKLGKPGSIVTNTHAGGSRTTWAELAAWARRTGNPLPPAGKLEGPALASARALARLRPTLSHIGIDVAVDRNNRIYLLDFNVVPGRDLLTPAMRKRVTSLTTGFAGYLARGPLRKRRT